MAKKKATKKAPKRDDGKVRFEVRFDSDVAEGLRIMADGAGVSVNQLLHGLARWAVKARSFEGDPQRSEDGFVTAQLEPQQGAMWWGRAGNYRAMSAAELEAYRRRMIAEHGTDVMIDDWIDEVGFAREVESNGEVYCHLDFTERRVVRED